MNPTLGTLLSPLSLLYRPLVGLRNRWYDRPRAARRAELPVVSVGNLTVGGTGKTPLVAWIARELQQRGQRPAVVSRGYGGFAGRGPLLVSGSNGPTCSAQIAGDEPFLLSRLLPGVPVVVGSDRVAGAAEARRAGAQVVILDDGYQHRRLARQLDVLLVDGIRRFGNGRLLPAGPLREPLSSLRRAGLVLITRSSDPQPAAELVKLVRDYNPDAPVLTASHRPTGWIAGDGSPRDAPQRALAFCGIGDPEGFRKDLTAQGLELVDFVPHRDHHRFAAPELRKLGEAAAARDAVLVTTEKDLVRCKREWLSGLPVETLALRIEAELHSPDALLDRLEALTGERG